MFEGVLWEGGSPFKLLPWSERYFIPQAPDEMGCGGTAGCTEDMPQLRGLSFPALWLGWQEKTAVRALDLETDATGALAVKLALSKNSRPKHIGDST